MKVVIPGGNGVVGRVLGRALTAAGHDVVVLSRRALAAAGTVAWDARTVGAWGVRIGLLATRWMAAIGAWFLRTDTELVFKSRRVVPGRLLDAGFGFEYPGWPAAAQHLLTRH